MTQKTITPEQFEKWLQEEMLGAYRKAHDLNLHNHDKFIWQVGKTNAFNEALSKFRTIKWECSPNSEHSETVNIGRSQKQSVHVACTDGKNEQSCEGCQLKDTMECFTCCREYKDHYTPRNEGKEIKQ